MAKEEWRIQIAAARQHAYELMVAAQAQIKESGGTVSVYLEPVRFEPIDDKAHRELDRWG